VSVGTYLALADLGIVTTCPVGCLAVALTNLVGTVDLV
jgi:hypothetical protein